MAKSDVFHVSDADERAFSAMFLRETKQYGVVFYDLERRITGWSAGAAFITGWTAQDVVGQLTRMLFVPEDRERLLDEHEANTAAVVGVGEDERWHLRKDGSRFWSSGLSVPMRGEAGELHGFVKIFRDATHLRARTRYLENELQAHARQQKQLDSFVGTVAHEMRNPLSPLKSAVQLMSLPAVKPETVQGLVPVMHRQIDAIERLVEDLVDLTRVHAGKMSVVYEQSLLQPLLAQAMDACRDQARQRAVKLHLVAPSVPIAIEVDCQRLIQVLNNLINNAVKFTHRGGNVWLTATVDKTHMVLYLKDDGAGIAPDLLPKIFDAFTQAASAGSGRGAGIGIGLSVVKEIVALHQGTIEVRSEGPEKGTEFVVRIPLRKPEGSEAEL
jgi:PAS domain S-box-containing protein